MSFELIEAVWPVNVSPAPKKLVLLFMAYKHNGQTGQLNPSVDTVARACGISSAQARRHLHALIADGILSVVGNVGGGYHKASSRRYQLNLDIPTPSANATPDADATPCTDATDPLHPCTRPLASMHETPCTDASQKGIDKEKIRKGKGNNARTRADAIDCPPDVSAEIWEDWLRLRKGFRAEVTKTVLKAARLEAGKAGMTLEDFLVRWCLRGTKGLEAEWLKQKQHAHQANRQEAVQANNQAAMNRWMQSEGGVHESV